MSRTIEELIPDYLRGLPVYIPGKPIEEVERELKIHAVKLASNENPLGPSPKGIEAARAVLAEAHRYPDGGTHRLREKLAERNGISPEELFVGLGSSEIIDLAARVLLRPGLQGLTSEGSYAPFSVAIRASGAELVVWADATIVPAASINRSSFMVRIKSVSFQGNACAYPQKKAATSGRPRDSPLSNQPATCSICSAVMSKFE